MSNHKPKSLSELLAESDSALGRLADRARTRVALADHIRAGIAPELGERLAGCNLRDDGTLVVIAESPEWAARLRFEADHVLSLCREIYPATVRVRIRVAHHPG